MQNMINFDDVTKNTPKEHNLNKPKIPDHSYRLIIIRGSGSGKTFIIKSNKSPTRY